MTRLTIGVFGTGDAGGYFGGRLAEAGEDVRFIARGAHLAALSGVGAISRVPVGVIRTQPETRRLLLEALEEIYGLALTRRDRAADGHGGADARLHRRTAGGRDDVAQRDVLGGRASELEARGAVRLRARLGVEVPVHRVICAALVGRERSARGIG
jgi:2-dehydropantoate 2-reductase